MNCKPGDIAYITHPSMLGKLVTVLYAAPVGKTIRLPNNTPAMGMQEPGDWVIQSMGAPFEVQRFMLGRGLNEYAVMNDRWLRPIRGDGLEDEAPRVADKPQPLEA